jgi:hypothetical protein
MLTLISCLIYNTYSYVIYSIYSSLLKNMPTKEWLEQHTKIQAYLDADLSTKLTFPAKLKMQSVRAL